MSVPPKSSVPRLENWKPAVTAHGVFTAEECEQIIALAEQTTPGRLLGQGDEQKYRNCDVSWLGDGAAGPSLGLQARLGCARQANQDLYSLDIVGFTERFQIITYKTGDHIDWHIDIGPRGQSMRKISMVIQLSDPATYEGGDFEIFALLSGRSTAPRARRRSGLSELSLAPGYRGDRRRAQIRRLLGRRPPLPVRLGRARRPQGVTSSHSRISLRSTL